MTSPLRVAALRLDEDLLEGLERVRQQDGGSRQSKCVERCASGSRQGCNHETEDASGRVARPGRLRYTTMDDTERAERWPHCASQPP